jgi:integrase/recombinase XerC
MLLKAFRDYLTIEKNYSGHTVLAYSSDVQLFGEWLRKEMDLDFEDPHDLDGIHHRSIRTWMGDLLNEKNSKKTAGSKTTLQPG